MWAAPLTCLERPLPARPAGVSKNALPGGSEEVPHLIVLQARTPDQHDGMARVVTRDVVGFRIIAQECGPLFKIGADDKRSWFRGPVASNASHEPLAELEGRRTVHRALVQVRKLVR
jgi:hypothetical protein